jgi:hypothetical protein
VREIAVVTDFHLAEFFFEFIIAVEAIIRCIHIELATEIEIEVYSASNK